MMHLYPFNIWLNTNGLPKVLILVVMDDALVPIDGSESSVKNGNSLNPCCNG